MKAKVITDFISGENRYKAGDIIEADEIKIKSLVAYGYVTLNTPQESKAVERPDKDKMVKSSKIKTKKKKEEK